MIRVSQAGGAYNREDVQQMIEAIKELQKLVLALTEQVPHVDITTGKNIRLQVDSLTVEAIDL